MKTFQSRLILISLPLLAFAGAIAVRLVSIQVVHRDEYVRRSKEQTLQRQMVGAPRGRILDRMGRELATTVTNGADACRLYPHGDLAASVLGFVGKDGYGLGGAELAFDRYLRGEDGWTIMQRDAGAQGGRRHKYSVDLPSKPPRPGADVSLTIDLDMQTILQGILKQTMERCRAKGAMGIVMEPSTGRILAMANEPTFDPNFASRYALADRANACICLDYEPGSTFKLVTASAALQEGVFREADMLYDSSGVYVVCGQAIHDDEPYTGYLTFKQALARSSNACFAKVADRLGNDRFNTYVQNYGFGQRTGIALPGEESGTVHPMREWSGRTRVTMAIGQEVTATLLQMASLYAAVADDGVLLQPRICERIVDVDSTTLETSSVRPVRRVVSSKVAARLRAMMEAVVDSGTGAKAAIVGVDVAGKTGTGQKIDSTTNTYSHTRHYASFIGFVPAKKPVLLCGIVVDEPQGAATGGLAAAPAFRQVVEQVIAHPDLEYAEQILRSDRQHKQAPDGVTPVPTVCGLSVADARQRLAKAGFVCTVVGDADTVVHQSPLGVPLTSADATVKLYATGHADFETDSVMRVAIPDCRGKDLRDALNLLNVKGIRPCVHGAGRVSEQRPKVGSVVKEAAACTLFCAFGG